jgi:hypothetical protein
MSHGQVKDTVLVVHVREAETLSVVQYDDGRYGILVNGTQIRTYGPDELTICLQRFMSVTGLEALPAPLTETASGGSGGNSR